VDGFDRAYVSAFDNFRTMLTRVYVAARGFVAIENPSQYDLPQGVEDHRTPPNSKVYGISMYHQLHCLVRFLSRAITNLDKHADSTLVDDDPRNLFLPVRPEP
jgi:hypothetical protein